MDFIIEVIAREEADGLLAEMDTVLEEYKSLTAFTQLNEGVLDNLSDDLIQKVTEIQRRIEVIAKARRIVDKLQKSGGFSKEEVTKHRDRLRKNRKALTAGLRRVSKRMQQFQKAASKEIEKADVADKDEVDSPERNVDLRVYGKLAPFVMRKAASNGNVNDLDSDKYGESIETLRSDGLIDQDGNITNKGQSAWDNHSANKKKNTAAPSRDAMDDLADMGAQSDTTDDLEAFG